MAIMPTIWDKSHNACQYLKKNHQLILKKQYDVIIIGAGAAGLMCALRAGERGLSVAIIDKEEKPGQKILISGGGRCNFTNLGITPEAYISPNPHFCKSALSRYTQWHIIELLAKHGLSYTEKTLGQLFCDQKSRAIVEMLLTEAELHDVTLWCGEHISAVTTSDGAYHVACEHHTLQAPKLVIACGGPSFPKVGGSDFALRLAKQMKLHNTPFVPALVPLTLPKLILSECKPLAGVATLVQVSCNGMSFKENILFTHRGLSGPAILQISSYWKKGDELCINLLPELDARKALHKAQDTKGQQLLSTVLSEWQPKKLVEACITWFAHNKPMKQYSEKELDALAHALQHWVVTPSGSEGMKKAEVCTGGIHPDELSSKTFETHKHKGLYAIGEAVDVTGWLGGYNFQWAWSSGWCCGDSL